MGGIFFAAHRGKIEANPTLIDTHERGIEKGDRFVEQSPIWGCFYEAKTRKFIACEVRKPLILLHFSKNSISPLAPSKRDHRNFLWSLFVSRECNFCCSMNSHIAVSSKIIVTATISDSFVFLHRYLSASGGIREGIRKESRKITLQSAFL